MVKAEGIIQVNGLCWEVYPYEDPVAVVLVDRNVEILEAVEPARDSVTPSLDVVVLESWALG